MSKYKFDHIHVTSTDPAKTAEFYEKTFGADAGRKNGHGQGPVYAETGPLRRHDVNQ